MNKQKFLSRYVSISEVNNWLEKGGMAYLHKSNKIYRFINIAKGLDDYSELTYKDIENGNWQLVKKEWDGEYSMQDKVNSRNTINISLYGGDTTKDIELINKFINAKVEELNQELRDTTVNEKLFSNHRAVIYDELHNMESNSIKEEAPKLLVIELDKYESVPRVVYKGEEITGRVSVSFDWKTDDGEKHLPNFKIEHCEDNGVDRGVSAVRTIAYEGSNKEANKASIEQRERKALKEKKKLEENSYQITSIRDSCGYREVN